MTEKNFERKYQYNTAQSTLTRVATRFKKECEETYGYIPDEVKIAAEKIRKMEQISLTDDESNYEYSHAAYDITPMHKVKEMREYHFSAYWEQDEDTGEDIYRISWYFFANTIYTAQVGTTKIEVGDYESLIKKALLARGKYRYFCTHRPPSPGCIPDGYVSYTTYKTGSPKVGEVTYNEHPGSEELKRWGLVLDPKFDEIRKAYLEEQ